MTNNDNNKRILALDPSGTGTTGIFLKLAQKEEFRAFTFADWEQHLQFLVALVGRFKPSLVLYESTNYINSRGKDMTSLLKLIGGIESLSNHFALKVEKVPVNQVKELKRKLFKGQVSIPGLSYASGRGKGWSYAGERISVHCLEAYLVYWLWKAKQKDYDNH